MRSPKPTAAEIAAQAQVPVQEVVDLIQGKNVYVEHRRRIADVMNILGGVHLPTEMLETKHKSVTIILPQSLVDDYIGYAVKGISSVLKENGYDITFHIESLPMIEQGQIPLSQRWEHYRTIISDPSQCGAIIVIPFDIELIAEICREFNRPFVRMDHFVAEDVNELPTIHSTDRQGMYEIVQHLIGLGHKRIGFITGKLTLYSAVERLEGYKDALFDAKLPIDEELIVQGKWIRESGLEGGAKLLNLSVPPTAIVASNDPMALGAIKAACQMNLDVPNDISVTGFDDIPMTEDVNPPLTTVRQPVFQMGQQAAKMLIALIEGRSLADSVVQLPTELIIRKSTAPRRLLH